MLRVLLGSAGVALIVFGLFGGRSLELVHTKVTSFLNPQLTPDTQTVAAAPESDTTQSAVIRSNKEESLTMVVRETDAAKEEKTATTQLAKAASADVGEVPPVASATTVAEVPASARNKEVAAARAQLKSGSVNEPENPLQANPLQAVAMAKKDLGDSVSKATAVAGVIEATTGELPENKTLVVLKESVNLRQGPSTDHVVVLELAKGQELMEFKRDGKWVHVGAYGTAGKIGWVHRTLVGQN